MSAAASRYRTWAQTWGYNVYRRQLRQSQFWPLERLQTYAWRQLQLSLRAAAATPFYRERFRATGFDAKAGLRHPGELASLPLLSKADVRAAGDAMINRRRMRFALPAATSGTTGEPLRMWLEFGFVAMDYACIFRHWSWAGYRFRQPMAAIRSYVPAHAGAPLWRHSRSQNCLYFSAYDLRPDNCGLYLEKLLQFRPLYIKGYPSALAMLSEFAFERRAQLGFVRGLFAASETLTPGERESIEATFGRKLFNWYGMTEPAVILTECPAHEGLHVNLEYGYPEFLSSPDLQPDEYRLVATGFHNPVMPFVRYDTGDIVRLMPSAGPCPCGRGLPRVAAVLGRKDECMLTADGRRLPSINFYTVFRNRPEISQFQIVQYGRREVTVKLRLRPGAPPDTPLPGLREQLAARFGDQVQLSLDAGGRFLTNADGKTPVIVRRLGTRAAEDREEYIVSSQQAWQLARCDAPALKLDWNEADRLPSARVLQVLQQALRDPRQVHWYPDADQSALQRAVASYAGVPPSCVLLTHGSDAAIELLAAALIRPGDTVAMLTPNYDQFRSTFEQRGAALQPLPYQGQTPAPVAAWIAQMRLNAPRVFYVSNPNNPMGYLLSREDLHPLLRCCQDLRTVLVVDEAYFEFSGLSVAEWVEREPGLVVMRSFSKAFGMAGMRLGYLLMGDELALLLRRLHNPKSLTGLAQLAGIAALDDLDAMRSYVHEVRMSRDRLCAWLTAHQLRFWPSAANFVLFQFEPAAELVSRLAARGIFVRDRSRFLGSGHVRVTVGGASSTDGLLTALECELAALGQRSEMAASG